MLRTQVRFLDARVFGEQPALAGQGNLAYLEHVGPVADFQSQSGVKFNPTGRSR